MKVKKVCLICGRKFVSDYSNVCSLTKCKSAYQKAYQKAYRQKPEVKAHQKAYQKAYRQKPEVKAHQKAYHNAYMKSNYTQGWIAGKRFSVFTDGATEEMRKQLPKIKNKVLNDCIKNPRKYL